MAETEAILLRRFVRSGDAEAFAEIIRRYAGLVYGAALRVLADVDRASDIAQDTFLQLAKDAGNVTGSLPGWLHRVATHKAIDQVRRDATRRKREAEYTVARPQEETTDWREISPCVDEGLNLLDPHVRNILISHFLEGRSTREIARAQGVSQATVSRRIEMGVELLRAGLRRRGILVAAGALSLLLGENAVEAAPPALLTELGKIALISGSLATSTTTAGVVSGLGGLAAGVLTAVKTNIVVVATAAVLVVGTGSVVTYQHVLKPARQEASASFGSAESPNAGAGQSVASDSSTGAGGTPDAPAVAAGNSSQDVAARPPVPASQGIPGPEAETDPRTYMGPRGEGPVVANVMDSALAQRVPDPYLSGVGADSGQASVPPDFGPEGVQGQAEPRIGESPYETVLRLRREATAQTLNGFVDPNVAAAFSIGPVVAKAELTFMPPFRGSPVAMTWVQRQDTTTVRPADVLETPPDAPREPVYFVVRAGDREIQGITYRSIRSPGEVMLILDTDADGLWSDETTYVGRRLWAFAMTATYEFGPVFLRRGSTDPGGDSLYAQCSNGQWLTFCPAFYRDGTVVLDGRTYRIGLIDSDFDGRFNEPLAPAPANGRRSGCDMLAIDFNGDSQFLRRPWDEPEILSLGKLVRIAGRYYGIEVAADGGSIEFRQAEPASGRSDPGGKDSGL